MYIIKKSRQIFAFISVVFAISLCEPSFAQYGRGSYGTLWNDNNSGIRQRHTRYSLKGETPYETDVKWESRRISDTCLVMRSIDKEDWYVGRTRSNSNGPYRHGYGITRNGRYEYTLGLWKRDSANGWMFVVDQNENISCTFWRMGRRDADSQRPATDVEKMHIKEEISRFNSVVFIARFDQ